MIMPGFTAECGLDESGVARYGALHRGSEAADRVVPQLFDLAFFVWCVWTFGEWGACWRAAQ